PSAMARPARQRTEASAAELIGLPQMQDVYVVYSTVGGELLQIRLVIADDRTETIAIHRENYPDTKRAPSTADHFQVVGATRRGCSRRASARDTCPRWDHRHRNRRPRG